MKKIFVSYRREPDQYVAGNLSRELRRQFGESQVFRDKESIEGGVSWKQHVLDEIDRDSVLLVLIGRDWSNARDNAGNRRLDNVDDPIRLEIADAMRDGAAIIPLLLENALMPAASELPQELVPLAELNALKLRDGDWEADVAKIVQRLEKLGAKRMAPDSPSVSAKRSAKAIWSLVIAALIAIGFFNETNDREALGGFLVLALVALALAGFAYFDIKQRKATGKGLAIAGLAASALTAIMALGMLMETEAPNQSLRIDPPVPTQPAQPAQATAPSLPAQSSPPLTSADRSAAANSNSRDALKTWAESEAVVTTKDGAVTTLRAETLSNCISVNHELTLTSGQAVPFERIQSFEVLQADPLFAPNAKATLLITLLDGKSIKESVGAGCDVFGYNDLGRFTTYFQDLKRVDFRR